MVVSSKQRVGDDMMDIALSGDRDAVEKARGRIEGIIADARSHTPTAGYDPSSSHSCVVSRRFCSMLTFLRLRLGVFLSYYATSCPQGRQSGCCQRLEGADRCAIFGCSHDHRKGWQKHPRS